jgi:cyclopropane fatty-acyl-phospholipid synthase-like methyltransferase
MASRPPYPHPGSSPPARPDDLYVTRPPWDIGRPQPAFLTLAQTGALSGRVLDAGCGTGEHALMAAALGLDATGIDLATNALATAERKAHERGLTARFLCHDARRLADLGEMFDTVLDCGLFHIFNPTDRAAYVAGLRAALSPGGRYFMLGFSDQEPAPWPHKLRRDEITTAFADRWHVDSIEPATIDARTEPAGVRAWLVCLTRR